MNLNVHLRTLSAIVTIAVQVLCSACHVEADPTARSGGQRGRMDSLLLMLDEVVDRRAVYESRRLARIEALTNTLHGSNPASNENYDTNLMLFREYKQYQCDSALVYLNRNMEIAERSNDAERQIETKLLLSSMLEQAGMYKESADLLESIDRWGVPERFRLEYFFGYRQVYSSLAMHTKDRRLAGEYAAASKRYDSLVLTAVGSRDDEFAMLAVDACLLDAGMYDRAMQVNDTRLARAAEWSTDYAYIAYHRAMNYAGRGDHAMATEWLVRSAIADFESAIKDYAALWMVAETLFNEGDLERSYRYIRTSWDDIRFYNARLRHLQTAKIQTIIDETYKAGLREKIVETRRYAAIAGLLAIFLAVSLVLIHRQMTKLRTVRDELRWANSRLNELNDELRLTNDSLRRSNADLSESNLIKEKYIGRFLNLCSVYIDRLDTYRRTTHKKLRSGQSAELLRTIDPQENLDADLRELYANFDATFLQLFPDFVTEFNKLLHEGEAVVPKRDELLTTELRIYALIRLGINDSVHIAEFLRYSLNTIYNYRARMRNKARVARGEFEDMVRLIR